ncbi:hypothetical protein AK812_SmicGene41846 [Symbiodinium microadriaticum]|uniref:Uncharacterized protein n=1 Tax=Symbiodinium microadriaticum TaxID=2951 RepID=A0A1Q9C553_SYMMI|nr:hypothetical protein AK812_SmicGene41846 [Symbiodinium microadriaticum]
MSSCHDFHMGCKNISQGSSNFNTSGNGTRASPTGTGGLNGPQSPLRRNRLRAATATGGINLENYEGVPEDEVFMHILDLLEMQDEFDSSMASDRDSEAYCKFKTRRGEVKLGEPACRLPTASESRSEAMEESNSSCISSKSRMCMKTCFQ